MTDLLFLAFAAVTIGAAILAIEARDLVYGAAALGIAFLGVAGLFFLLDAAYVGWFQIAVYIGAVVVLILFTVMLVGPKMGETPLGLKRVSLLAAILVSLLLGMTGALANATAFPGQDSCGSGCDGSCCWALDNHLGLQTERGDRSVETIEAERLDLSDSSSDRRNSRAAISDSNPICALQTAKRKNRIRFLRPASHPALDDT